MKRIGFLSFGHWQPRSGSQTRTAADALLQTIELAQAAEDIGIDGAFVRVHHFERQLSSPFPLLAAIAARTSRIEIGTAVIDMRYENPLYLARTLRGTRVWAAIEAAWRSGAALAGCSAGAIALTDWVPAMRDRARESDHGLGVLPHLRVLPHFDKLASWAPDLVTRAAEGLSPGMAAIGIDEDTAIVDLAGRGRSWQVHGRQQAWVLDGGPRRGFPAGTTLPA